MPVQWELNGFVLGQRIEAIEGQLGEPFKTQNRGDWEYKVYRVDREAEIFMVFGFPTESKMYSGNAMTIQLAGSKTLSTTPFVGLNLGDPAVRIEEIFGKPTRTDGSVGNEKTQWNYPDKNYSFQVDETGKLTSIMISVEKMDAPDDETSEATMARLREGLKTADVDILLDVFAGDAELFVDDEVYSYKKSARAELTDAASEFRKYLLEGSRSLKQMALVERPFEDIQMRLWGEAGMFGYVHKYPDSAIIEEIALIKALGKWRIWEVHFR